MAKRKDQVMVEVAKSKSGYGPRVADEPDRITQLEECYDSDKYARSTWEEYQARWYRKRYGIRPKKTFPWPNCANFHLPLADKNIRKVKPAYVNAVNGVTPVSSFYATNGKNRLEEMALEKEFHWLWKSRMNTFDDVNVAADLTLQNGFSVAKLIYLTTYRTVTECVTRDQLPDVVTEGMTHSDPTAYLQWLETNCQMDPESDMKAMQESFQDFMDGKKESYVTFEVVEYDAPKLIIRDARDVIVPPGTGKIQDAERIFDVSYVTKKDLLDEVRSGRADKANVEKILEQNPTVRRTVSPADSVQADSGGPAESDVLKKTGINLVGYEEEEVYLRIEGYHWVLEKGKPQRQLTVWIYGCPNDPLSDEKWEEPFWPFEILCFERSRYDHYSPRGIPDMLDSLQTSLVVQHNQMLDRQTLATALSYLYEPGAIQPNAMRFIPGQGIPVAQGRRFEFLTPPQMDQSFDKTQLVLKSWAEELVGNPDFGMAGGLSQTRGESRSATEIQAIMSEKQMTQSLDIAVWMECWRKIFLMTWKLWVKHGPREFTVRFGYETIPVNRLGKVVGEVNMEPNGTLWNINPQARLAKAEARLKFAGNPYVNQRFLYEDYFREDDWRLLPYILNSEEEVQKTLAQQAEANKKGPSTSLSYKDLPPQGQVQLAQQAGITLQSNASFQPAPGQAGQGGPPANGQMPSMPPAVGS